MREQNHGTAGIDPSVYSPFNQPETNAQNWLDERDACPAAELMHCGIDYRRDPRGNRAIGAGACLAVSRLPQGSAAGLFQFPVDTRMQTIAKACGQFEDAIISHQDHNIAG